MSVLVYTENWDGAFKKLSFELVSYAAKLAEEMQTDVIALSIGHVTDEELNKLGQYGVKRILKLDQEAVTQFDPQIYARALAEVATREQARLVVMADNNAGKSIAPRLSVRLKAAVASGVSHMPDSISPFVIKTRAFSGNAFAVTELPTEVKIVTISQNSFELEEKQVDTQIAQADIDLADMRPSTVVKEVEKQADQLLLTDAEIVISGGRGMKAPENWAPIEELATLLNGATACSRPVSDEGWRPHEEHTGQTGKIIAPNVYFAIGISGATQHLAGVSGSKYIIAINNDKEAPIFDAAQYGMVGDATKIMPKLVEALKKAKSA